MNKDSLVKGTFILAIAALIARVLGVAQKVPLKHLLGDTGMASFGIAYSLYSVLLIVATAGIPSAISKLVSERMETGRVAEAVRIYRASMIFAAVAGILLTVILIVLAPYYAEHIADDPDAALAIRALAPALLLFPMIAMMRGFFQGMQYMSAGGISQIVEQIMRVATAVILAYVLLDYGYSHTAAIAGASFGGVAGSVGAFLVMVYYYRKFKRTRPALVSPIERRLNDSQLALPNAYKLIFAYSIPITFSALAVPIINFIDASSVIPLLKGLIGYDSAKEALGILSARAQSLAGIPIILAIAVSQTALPVISAAYAKGDQEEVARKASQALRLSAIFGLFFVLIIVVGARPLNGFLFADTKGTSIIVMLTIASMLQIVMMTTASILNGLGLMKKAAIHVYVGIAVKLVITLLLSRWIGMTGVIGSTFVCFLVITLLNYKVMNRYVKVQALRGRWLRLTVTTAVSGLAGFAADRLSAVYIVYWSDLVNYMVQSVIVVGVTSMLFGILLLTAGVLKQEEIRFLPARVRRLSSRFVRAD